MLLQMAFNLILTVTAELTAAIILKVQDSRDKALVVLINCITNPIVNYCMNGAVIIFHPAKQSRYILLAFLEAAVLFSEGRFYKKLLKYNRVKPMTLSLILNGTSFLCGAVITLIYNIRS